MANHGNTGDERSHDVTLAKPFAFLSLFVTFFLAFYAAYSLLPDSLLRDVVYHHGICQVGAQAINLFAPGEATRAVANTIASDRVILEIVRGCDGIGSMSLLLAAVLAFPTHWKCRIIGLIAGTAIAYAINQARIVVLYFVAADHPSLFTPMHTYYLPMFSVLLYIVLFATWTHIASPLRWTRDNSA